MASLKAIRKRITSVKNTEQITKAMKMVAAAKLRRAQQSVEGARPYADKLTDMLQRVAVAAGDADHPFLSEGSGAAPHLILVTSDRGLCGAYNSNLIKAAAAFLTSEQGAGATMTACGRRGNDHFRKRDQAITEAHINLASGFDLDLAVTVADEAAKRFVSGESGSVYIVYSRFFSAMSQRASLERLLPFAPETDDAAESEAQAGPDYKFEPDAASILGALLPQFLRTKVFQAMLEANASEHGARMTAMESASRNAGEMIERLTLEMNRARQAAITTELMEIISGAEALNG